MASSGTPLWGQAWELVITSANASGAQQTTLTYKDWTPEALRVTFEVLQAMNTSPMWYADISVYNMSSQAEQDLLLNATWVTLRAGFQTGPTRYATIWDGPVFQVIYTREAVVDQRITFHCVANPLLMDAIVSFSMGPFSDQAQLLARMASEADLPPISTAQGTLGAAAAQRTAAVQYPRGNTVFGKVAKFIAQVGDSDFLQSWNDGKQAYLSEVDSGSRTPDYVYAPPLPPGYTPQMLGLPSATTTSIVGTPQQIQQGAIFTVLLDPRLRVGIPPQLVQLARTNIGALLRTPSINSELPTALSADLTFFVSQVRHVGDTRGNDWYTEVTGFSTAYAQTLFNMFT